ncbi:MAG: ATP-binding protein [Candidatus Thorarchaeota archaeon]
MLTEIAIISGKGGTGKTTVSAAFITISGNVVVADCDVDAPNLHIILQPNVLQTDDFISSKVAIINEDACTKCGLCQEVCRFDAVEIPDIDLIKCEGCGVCAYVCPEKAIDMQEKVSGHVFKSETKFGPMSHAKLLPGEGNSGKLVTEVRRHSIEMARENGHEIIIIDGSPGIGCSVIATLAGTGFGIIVTEPTLSGIHDMKRILTLLMQFKVKPVVIINKYDLNLENTKYIEYYCQMHNIEILGKLAFDRIIPESIVACKSLPEYAPNHELTKSLVGMWKRVIEITQIVQS